MGGGFRGSVVHRGLYRCWWVRWLWRPAGALWPPVGVRSATGDYSGPATEVEVAWDSFRVS